MNCDLVLERMKGVADELRGAYFQCSATLAIPNRILATVEERVQGRIAHEMRGSNGFGYDPLFFYPEFGKTFGEVAPAEKHGVSHRGKALKKICEILLELFEKKEI